LHSGTWEARFSGTAKLSLAASPVYLLLDHLTDWFALNSGYVIFVFIAIIIDHILGTYLHAFVKRDFSLRKNIQGFFGKTLLVVAVGVLVEGMASILGPGMFVTDYFAVVSRLMVFVYPAGSALMNVAILTDGAFPPVAWMERIKRFNSELDVKQFQGKEEDKNVPDEED
jgi:hypothetical protein